MVVVLVLQMAAVLTGIDWSDIDWSDSSTWPQVTGPLVAIAPMGFMGLLIALLGSRLDHPQRGSTPLRWLVCLLSAVLAIGMIAAVPLSLSANSSDAAQRLDQLSQTLNEARKVREDENQVKAFGEQLAQAGRLAADATAEDKLRAGENFVDIQIAQLEEQRSALESQQSRAESQRLIGGTGTAAVLAIAFALLSLAAVL